MVRMVFKTKIPGTLNEVSRNPLQSVKMAMEYALKRSGQLTVGATEATLFAKSRPEEPVADLQFQCINFSTEGAFKVGLHAFPAFMFNFCVCRPDSRGELTLRSPDVNDKPLLRPNYLTAPSDVRIMLESAKLGRRIQQTKPFADLIEQEVWPGPNAQSDDEMLQYIRETGSTVYHPCGTNRMGSDDRAVVDTDLCVRGVTGLRVVDASVFPLVPSSNIHPATLMLAERGAELIRKVA